ncbi:hypothetical protein GCM10018782_33160 [Streptomyces griseoaurantiacus]|nr:hypothetical protein GCM10018782_33160 [Streptomyces griseoaurantiacus]
MRHRLVSGGVEVPDDPRADQTGPSENCDPHDVFSLSRVAHVDMLGVVCGRDGGAAPFSRAPAPYTVMTREAVRV